MKKISLFLIVYTGLCLVTNGQDKNILPSREQVKYLQKEIGVIIHLDINIYAPETFDYAKKETLPPASAFNPTRIDTDQWIRAAKSAGARYAVLTAKHGTGFALWHTKANGYHTGNSPIEIDVVKSFIKSCKKYGLKPGIYYNTNMNTFYGAGYTALTEEKRLEFNEVVYQQLSELWGNYGKLFEIWFDGGVMSDPKTGILDRVTKLLEQHQPNALLFGGLSGMNNLVRWVGNEDGRTPYPHWNQNFLKNVAGDGSETDNQYHGDPNGDVWMPGEADFPNRKKTAWNGGWLWRSNEDQYLFQSDELMDRFYTSVGRNSNMMIGMAIDTSGLFPEKDTRIFEEFGAMLKQRENKKIATTRGSGKIISLKIKDSSAINQVEIQEEIKHGQRIRKYEIDALIDGEWNKICEGTSIGYKRIQFFDAVVTPELRIKIIESAGNPILKSLSAYQ
jgi:alpha-L-fucosidase